jgi:adenylate kinase
MDKGELVPDDLVVEMVEKRLRGDDTVKNFLMDGFPRTIPQAEALEKMLEKLGFPLEAVVHLKVDEDLLVRRLTNRRTCRSCGKIWNLLTLASSSGFCPECEGEFYQRGDDEESVIRNRLLVYREQTEFLVVWYEERGKLRSVDAMSSPDETFKAILAVLE